MRTLLLERVLRRLVLGHVDDAVHVEADLLCVCAPVLVVEAVGVLSVFGGGEGVVARGDAALVDLVGARGGFDLRGGVTSVGRGLHMFMDMRVGSRKHAGWSAWCSGN